MSKRSIARSVAARAGADPAIEREGAGLDHLAVAGEVPQAIQPLAAEHAEGVVQVAQHVRVPAQLGPGARRLCGECRDRVEDQLAAPAVVRPTRPGVERGTETLEVPLDRRAVPRVVQRLGPRGR